MTKLLTESPSYDPVYVPVGTDTRNDAADVVEAMAQAIVNRVKYIGDILAALAALDFARRDAFNAFTAGPLTVNDSDGDGVIASEVYPGGIAAGNKYLPIGDFRCTSTVNARLYVGDSGAQGNFVVTLNAEWDIATQLWSSDDTSVASYALFFGGSANDALLTERAAGAGTWATWATATSGLSQLRLRSVDAYDVSADHDLSATNLVSCAGDVDAGGDVNASGNFLYTSPKTRTTSIKLMSFNLGSATISNYGRDGIVLGAGNIVVARLELPSGATFDQVDVIVSPNGASAMTLRAHRRTAGNFSTPVHGTGSTIDSDTSSGTSQQVLTVNFGSLTVSETEEYWISIEDGQAGDLIQEARIYQWTDPGPRNN